MSAVCWRSPLVPSCQFGVGVVDGSTSLRAPSTLLGLPLLLCSHPPSLWVLANDDGSEAKLALVVNEFVSGGALGYGLRFVREKLCVAFDRKRMRHVIFVCWLCEARRLKRRGGGRIQLCLSLALHKALSFPSSHETIWVTSIG